MKREGHRRLSQSGRRKSGASLIEALVVVAIMLVLTTLYWRSHAESRAARLRSACRQNLERIFMAMEIYAKEGAGCFPAVAGARGSAEALAPLVPRYTVDTSLFLCPASGDRPAPDGVPFKQSPISYAYYMGRKAGEPGVLLSDRQIDALPKTAGQQVFSRTGRPPGNNHGKAGGSFLFCDGHVQAVSFQTPCALELSNGTVLLNP